MPTVPQEYVPYATLAPQGQLQPNNLDRANPADFGGQVGQALDQTGNMLEQHAVQRQQLVNETNVNDVYANRFSPQLQALRENYMKLEGKDAEEQFPAYQKQVQDLMAQTRTNLPNPMQQKLFDEQSIRRTERELDTMSNYAAVQNKQWQWNTHVATIDNLAADSAANFNQPQHLHGNSAEVDKQTLNYGMAHGWSEDQIKDQMNRNQAKLWGAVIERQALYDPAQAMRILDAKTRDGTLPGDAQLKLQEKLKPQMETLQSQSAYGKVTGGATAQQIGTEAQRQGVDPNTMLTIWSAEGAVTNPAARNPNSSATGIFQHLDNTWSELGGTDRNRFDPNKQIELGVALAKQNTQALTKDLGRQPQPWEVYLAHQQGIAGAQALLHADPGASAASVVGNVDAITNNMPGATKATTVAQFSNFIQGYVQRHAQMYDPSGAPTVQNLAGNYEQHLRQLADQAHQDFPNDPDAVDRYQSHYMQQVGRTIKAEEMTDNANRRIIDNALTGPRAFQSKDALLADPVTKAAYDAVYEKDHRIADTIDRMFNKKNLGEQNPAPTTETDREYKALLGYANSNPAGFSKMVLTPYYGAFPESQYTELNSRQHKILDNDAAESQKNIAFNSALSSSKDIIRLAAASPDSPYYKLDDNPGLNPQAAFKYYQFRGEYEKALDVAQENNNGKPLSIDQQRQVAQHLLFPQGAPAAENPRKPGKPGTPTTQQAAPQPTISPAQPQIDFTKFKPENQDDFSKAVAMELQANGKLVNDATIASAKALIKAQNKKPGE